MAHVKPPASPGCWGLKYQDGEKECEQCRYVDSCRPAMFERCTSDTRTSLPVIRNYAPPPVPAPPTSFSRPPQFTTATAMVPMPQKPYYPPAPATIPMPTRVPTVPMPQQVQPAPAPQPYYQSSTGYSLPSYANPNPMTPMHRPGASSPAYYFTQYPGESVAKRVGKNLVLRAFEAIFGELWQFFKHYTWPPGNV